MKEKIFINARIIDPSQKMDEKGSLILDNSYELRVAAGLIIIIFSLHIMGVINLKFLNYEKRINVEKNSGKFGPILIGMAFGFGWTPCIGPILGSILALASTDQS